MFVTVRPPVGARGGRALLSSLLQSCLESVCPGGLVVRQLGPRPPRRRVRATLRGHIDGLDAETIADVLGDVRERRIGHVVIDGSNLGSLAAAIRRDMPQVEVTTFCHNVEARFFLGALRRSRSPRALGVLVANYLAERRAVRASDRLVALSLRDGRLLGRLYGRAATHILPMALEDRLTGSPAPDAGCRGYLLFVGGDFYANVAGLTWFVDNVVPRIAMRTCIVGYGLDALRPRLERPGKVAVVGPVDSLEGWYANACVAIAPIFDGSGMKTKVAEAMMFGKAVIGTSGAFAGYEEVADRAGWVCDTADAFVAAVREVERAPPAPFQPALRELYEDRYSRAAATRGLSAILSSAGRA